jgi:hypothetical protein
MHSGNPHVDCSVDVTYKVAAKLADHLSTTDRLVCSTMIFSVARTVRPAAAGIRAARALGVRAASKHTLPELPYAYDARLPAVRRLSHPLTFLYRLLSRIFRPRS